MSSDRMDGVRSRLVKLSAEDSEEITPGTFRCRLDSSYLSNVTSVALKSCQVLNSEYNIRNDSERTFTYTILATQYEATLPQIGFYSASEIISIIEPQIQATLTGLFPSSVFTMEIGEYSKKIEVLETVGIVTYDAEGGLNTLLGNTVSTNVLPGVTQVFDSFPDLNGTDLFQIILTSKTPKTILNSSAEKLLHTNSLGMVPCTVPFGSLQGFTNPSIEGSRVIFDHPEELILISFKVRNGRGDVLLNQKPHLKIELAITWSV